MGQNKFANMQKIVLALLIAAASAKSVALPSKISSVNQLLDAAKIGTDCVFETTSATGSGSGSEEACKPLSLDCLKLTDGKVTIDCATSACKGKGMCKAAASAKHPAKCRKAIEGSFESNC